MMVWQVGAFGRMLCRTFLTVSRPGKESHDLPWPMSRYSQITVHNYSYAVQTPAVTPNGLSISPSSNISAKSWTSILKLSVAVHASRALTLTLLKSGNLPSSIASYTAAGATSTSAVAVPEQSRSRIRSECPLSILWNKALEI